MWYFEIFLKLILAHAITDFAMQNDAMARYKSILNLPSVNDIPKSDKPSSFWPYFLFNHAAINGAGVWIATGTWLFCLFEIPIHAMIDHMKCRGWININQDQFLHLLSKLFYMALIIWKNY